MPVDTHRPRYHVTAPSNWLNDPNGLIQWRGEYHLFYQHNPTGPLWGNIHWGHAVSRDLVQWEHLPLAMVPTPGGPDADGVWSGCAVDDGGVPTMLYTGVFPETVCVATGSGDLRALAKYEQNPVIAAPPVGLDVTGFRDPCMWRDGETWYMVIGAGIKDAGGAMLLYRSPDLRAWEYLGPALVGDGEQSGIMWECPAFFPFGDPADNRWALVISNHTDQRTELFTGVFDGRTFAPDHHAMFDLGATCFYAPQTFVDDQDRRVMFGWLRENRSDEALLADGWAGVMSLPHLLSTGPDGSLRREPAPELQTLRGVHRQLTAHTLAPDNDSVLPDWSGDCVEISAEIDPGDAQQIGLIVRRSPDGAEQTAIIYDAQGRLWLDRARSSLSDQVNLTPEGGVFALSPGENLRLRIFLDKSVIEVFANERACLTSRIYPTRSDSLDLDVFARGGTAHLKQVDLWQMRGFDAAHSR